MNTDIHYLLSAYFKPGWQKTGTMPDIAAAIIRENDPKFALNLVRYIEEMLNDKTLAAFDLLLAEKRGYLFFVGATREDELEHLESLMTEMKTILDQADIIPRINSVIMSDRLAGHPDDPDRQDRGIDDDNVPEEAIEYCKKAVEYYPTVRRLWFQLGRAYWANGYHEDAIEPWLTAAKMEHGGAHACLGNLYATGLEGMIEQDIEMACQFYRKAADAGFSPATTLLYEIEKQATALPATDPMELHYPDLLYHCSKGDLSAISVRFSPDQLCLYLSHALVGMRHYCPHAISDSYDPDLYHGMMSLRITGEEDRDAFTRSMAEGELAELCQQAVDDGKAFAANLGCASEYLQQTIDNIFFYLDTIFGERNEITASAMVN